LHAPNDGKHPWAAKRAGDGHPAPWKVVWFEYGNESEHGDHKGRKMTAQEYAQNFLAYQRAMKAVDRRIKFGAVIATGFPKLDEWARPVLKLCGKQADFVIHHSYKPGYYNNDGKPDAKTLFRAGLAVADQIQAYYDEMNALIREVTGRRNVPIAVTEYNGHFVQEKPAPYRHCLGNALINAEMLRVFLRPQNHIVMANFWQFANEYWGQVKGYIHKGEPLVKRPQYFPFELYHHHFGTELLDARVECGRYETDGGWGVAPARGEGAHLDTAPVSPASIRRAELREAGGRKKPGASRSSALRIGAVSECTRGEGSRFQLVGNPVALSEPWKLGDCKGAKQRTEGDALAVEFTGDAGDVNYFHARKFIPAEPKTGYHLTAWIKTEELTSARGACFQIGDARGWVATKSSAMTPDVRGTKDWTKVESDYTTLPDTKEIEVIARRLGGGGAVTGRAWYRDLQVQKFTPQHYAAVPYLSVNASRSRNGRKIFLIVVNKHLDAAVTATINIASFKPHHARAWSLTGPSVDATNEKDPTAVTVKERDLGAVKNGFPVEFPPHSMTAIEVE
ncbi:MAG: hypothetical protein FJ388_15280, partial [Verrucomicrobia bacterium]|nr:hypothetical protein [Verrucomicrobiota bacterium]